jgi:magnesium-transporting ATPase (P-type)
MLLLHLIGGGIYLALGDLGEALMLLAFAGFSVVITAVQESRSERALEALREIASPRALVLRDGVHRRIPGRDVVRGDLVLLGEGDRVPADGWVIDSNALALDESLLTGEGMSTPRQLGPMIRIRCGRAASSMAARDLASSNPLEMTTATFVPSTPSSAMMSGTVAVGVTITARSGTSGSVSMLRTQETPSRSTRFGFTANTVSPNPSPRMFESTRSPSEPARLEPPMTATLRGLKSGARLRMVIVVVPRRSMGRPALFPSSDLGTALGH